MNPDEARELGTVEVLTTEGKPVRLQSLWAGRSVVLALVRHFG